MVLDPLEGTLRHLVAFGAIALGGAAFAVLGLALVAESLHRLRRAPRSSRFIHRFIPTNARWIAAAIISVGVVSVPRSVGASETVRDWLRSGTSTTTNAGSTTTTSTSLPAKTSTTTLASTSTSTSTSTTARPGTEVLVIELPPPLIEFAPTPPPVASSLASKAQEAFPIREQHVVRRGDCLWSIAAARLGANVSPAQVDAAWRNIYAINQSTIGNDPNLILVGMQLELPPL